MRAYVDAVNLPVTIVPNGVPPVQEGACSQRLSAKRRDFFCRP
jgi:hypothetical protein